MNAMRDMLVLCYWLDNSKKATLETSLSDRRRLPKDKANLLRDLENENAERDRSVKSRHRS